MRSLPPLPLPSQITGLAPFLASSLSPPSAVLPASFWPPLSPSPPDCPFSSFIYLFFLETKKALLLGVIFRSTK